MLIITICLAVSLADAANRQQHEIAELRHRVLKADNATKKYKAYIDLFHRIGQSGLPRLLNDEDTSIALQAGWESHKKAAKRPLHIIGRTDDIYEPTELKQFVSLLNKRSGVSAPDWWAKCITDIDYFPRTHHAFLGRGGTKGPVRRESKEGSGVPEGAELDVKNDQFSYSSSGKTVLFPIDTFDEWATDYAAVVGERQSVVLGYNSGWGFSYRIAGFKGRGGKPVWRAEVWGTGVDGSSTPIRHWVEVLEKDGAAYVFGCDTSGMYLESFDIGSGKCRFRFCTSYWFGYTEKPN